MGLGMKIYILACIGLVLATWISSIIVAFPKYREANDIPLTGFFYLLVEDYFIMYLQRGIIKSVNQELYQASVPPLQDKIVLLTGGNKGLGLGAASHLFAHGAELIVPCRRCNQEKLRNDISEGAAAALAKFGGQRKLSSNNVNKIHTFDLDLSDMNEIDSFVANVQKKLGDRKVDIFISNAAAVLSGIDLTKQGFESMFAVNYLSNTYLFNLLHEKNVLKRKSARVITVTSQDHRLSLPIKTHLEKHKVKFGEPWGASLADTMPKYDYTKLLATTFYFGIQKQHEGEYAFLDICPGPVGSEITSNSPWPLNIIIGALLKAVFPTPLVARYVVVLKK